MSETTTATCSNDAAHCVAAESGRGCETHKRVTFERESVGTGDFTVQQTPMMQGADRWAVVQYTGTMQRVLYTLPTRSAAVKEARREWARVLKAEALRRSGKAR